jgi:OmpA-OmpF porin, OOP family
MRAPWISLASTAISIAVVCSVAPARAASPYSSDKVIDRFVKDKAATAAYKSESQTETGGICIGTAAECPPHSPPPAPVQFDLLANFDFNSDTLTQAAKENLDQFAKALLDPRLKGETFEIDAHGDANGDLDYNQGLSERRANAVVSYLASQGVDPSLLIPRAFGKSRPRVANPFSPENRRVETHLVD